MATPIKDRIEIAAVLGISIGTYVNYDNFDDGDEEAEGSCENGEQIFVGFEPNKTFKMYLPDNWLENISKWKKQKINQIEPAWFLKLFHETGSIKLINYETGIDEDTFEEEIDGEQLQWLDILMHLVSADEDMNEEGEE